MSTSRYNNNLPISFSRLIFFFFKSFSRLSLKSRLTSRLISYRGGVAERDLGGGGGGGVSGVGCGKMNLDGEGVLQPFCVCWEEFGVGDGVTISDKKLVLSICRFTGLVFGGGGGGGGGGIIERFSSGSSTDIGFNTVPCLGGGGGGGRSEISNILLRD